MWQTLRPEPDGCGLACGDPAFVADRVGAAWDAVTALAQVVPLDQPSRLPGWSARDVLVHLGSWDEHQPFTSLLDDARAGRHHELDDTAARNAMVIAAHHDATVAEITDALHAARRQAVTFLGSAEFETIGRHLTTTSVGLLPVSTVVAACTYDLAVHALDLAPAAQVPSPLLDAGIGAVVDVIGALAARAGLVSTCVVCTPDGSWACGSSPQGWTTLRLSDDVRVPQLRWPTIEGAAADVLDATAGRRPPLTLVATRRLKLHDLPGLMTLLPALDSAPGLPGGLALRAAAHALSRTGRALGRLGDLTRRS